MSRSSYMFNNQNFCNAQTGEFRGGCACKKKECKKCFPSCMQISHCCSCRSPENLHDTRSPKSYHDPGLVSTCNPRPICNPRSLRRAVTTWKVTNLISNIQNKALNQDDALVSPWGIIIFNNQLWVVDGASDIITNYDLYGHKLPNSIDVRDNTHKSSFPTGIVVNCENSGFLVTNNNFTKPALFLIATEHGTVHGYNPDLDPTESFVVLNEKLTGEVTVYRGLAVANNTLYLADFYKGHIDVFDSNYNRLTGYNFIDNDSSDPIPTDYAPNNIVYIGCYLYVLYAKRDPKVPINDINGAGCGYISVFNLDGSFVRRFASRGALNSPWSMIPAPCECGFPPGSFLVGNNGDGRINIFDCEGRFVGPLLNQAGFPIVIEGLWGLVPHYTEFSEIFFTASSDQDKDGIVGNIVKDQIIYI